MDLLLSCVLLLLCLLGILILFRTKRGKKHSAGRVAAIVSLAIPALAAACYIVATVLFVSSIR